MFKRIAHKAKQTAKVVALYGSAMIVAAAILVATLYWGTYKLIMAVQLNHSCQTVVTTTTPEIAPAKIEVIDVSKGVITEVSAYNSVSGQTDDTPCIAADGSDICKRYQAGECIIATNSKPFGTIGYVEKIGQCTVADHMNSRFKNRVDIFMDKDVARAVNFGLQNLAITWVE
jgi:3D (Asp-Asp-Asp) domain-containing protein